MKVSSLFMKISAAIGAVFLSLSVSAAPPAASGMSKMINTDDFGHTFTFAKTPTRIVCLSGTRIDELFALGVGDRIVGMVENACKSYPATCRKFPSIVSIPSAGGWSNPNPEVIVSLRPDIIIAYDSEKQPGQYTGALKQTGIQYAAFATVNNVRHGLDQIGRMGKILCRQHAADSITTALSRSIDSLTTAIAEKSAQRPTVFYWWGTKNGTYGKRAAITDLIRRAGGQSVTADDDEQYFDISTESLVMRNPDVIVYSYWGEDQIESRREEIMHRPALATIKAIRDQRVFPIDGHLLHTAVLFPEAIARLDSCINIRKVTVK